MGRQVSRKVTQQGATEPCRACGRLNPAGAQRCWSCGAVLGQTSAPPPAGGSAPLPPAPPAAPTLVVELDDEPAGRVPKPVGVAPAPAFPGVKPRPKRSLWTSNFTFGLDGQPSCYWAVRTAMWGAWLFPPMFLVGIVLAVIGIAKGEPAAVKVLVILVAVAVVYCAIAAALILVIVRMASGIQW
jgi:hypothetical protein